MKFNMGCGVNPAPGYLNVDAAPESGADEIWNLEQTPWPWPDNCAEEVRFIHSLEHMGADAGVFLAIMKELYRICRDGTQVLIHVPHPRHDFFLNDPTHVRPITPEILDLFNRDLNTQWAAQGISNTPLALYTGVDFHMLQRTMILDEPFAGQFNSGELAADRLREMARYQLNVVAEYRIVLQARKPSAPPVGSA